MSQASLALAEDPTHSVSFEDHPAALPVDHETFSTVDDRGDADRLPPCPAPWRHPIQFLVWTVRTLFGLASLIVMLAVIAAIPLVNFIALGYLLDVEGRLARTGRVRAAFPLLALAPRLGIIALGIWLFLVPLRLLASMSADVHLIAPGSATDIGWQVATRIATVLVTVHLVLALARGGSLACFVRPIKNLRWLIGRLQQGDYLDTAGEHVSQFVSALRLPAHFWLGVRGFAVAFLWLLIPTALYAAARKPEGLPVILMVLGGFLLALTLSWAPFLQARFVAEDRWRAGFQLGAVRELYRHAPITWTFATILLYALALPLYLFKALLPPPDAMWPVTLVFILSIYPTRILTGWAYHRAVRNQEQGRRARWWLRTLCSLVLMPLLGFYVFLLYFTQFLGEHGRGVLFEHHALLLPVPF